MSSNQLNVKALETTFPTLYFLLLGGVTVCGWNATLNCIDYFSAKYPEYTVSFIFPIPIYLSHMAAIFSITKLSAIMSYNTRILGSLVIIISVTAFLPFEAVLFADTTFGISFIMILLFVLGFHGNICCASLSGLTSQLESKYVAYFLIGIATNNIIMNCLREIILLIFNPDSEGDIINVSVYFGCTVILLLISVKAHMKFIKSNFYARYFHPRNDRQIYGSDEETTIFEPLVNQPTQSRDLKTLLEVWKSSKLYVILLMVCYAQLPLSIPGLMLKKPIPTISNHTKTVTMLAAFNISMIIGKKLGQYRKYYNKWIVVTVVLFRFVLVGCFFDQAITVDTPILNTVWFGYVNIALFGLTLGFANVASFILGPELVSDNKKEVAGFISVFGVNLGFITGAFMAVPFRNISINSS